MSHRALATDYDGTIATDGRVEPATISALERLKAAGWRLVLVTGRIVPELEEVCPRLDLFDRIVAENGAVILRPGSPEVEVLGSPPTESFLSALRSRGVGPISVGTVVAATWEPHSLAAEQVIAEQGLDLRVIRNKRAVMILPAGVDKARGLAHALDGLGIAPADSVGVGDAENDLEFLEFCGFSAAVGNALPEVKSRVDLVTVADHGSGVVELIDRLLDDRTVSTGG